MNKKHFALLTVGLALSFVFSTLDATGQGFGFNRIKVFGPNINNQVNAETPSDIPHFNFQDQDGDGVCNPLFSNNGNSGFTYMMGGRGRHGGHSGHGCYGNVGRENPEIGGRHGNLGPLLEDGQIQLTATVTEVQESMFSVLNGAFVIDASKADLQYIHWFSSEDFAQDISIEAGQRVSLIGAIDDSESGAIIEASSIRIMDGIHQVLDEDEAGIRGNVDSIDLDAGQFVLSGIPIQFDDTTYFHSRISDEVAVEAGDSAAAHVKLIDSDGDDLVDSLFAESVVVYLN